MFDVQSALRELVSRKGSDLHLKVDSAPLFRVHGILTKDERTEPLSAEDTERALHDLLHDPHKLSEFAEDHEVDFSFEISGVARFRINAFRQRGVISLACRAIPHKISTVEELSLPEVIRELAEEERGIVLLTGTTGSGKSTTLAAMIDHMNETMSKHIVTIEDPIEFVHKDKRSVINQREVGMDTASFKRALRRVLRQDPDVILVGEMRDEETVQTALSAAETGHLVLSTIHTVDAMESINRMLDFFPPHQHDQARSMIAGTVKGVDLPATRSGCPRGPRRGLRDPADDGPCARHDRRPLPDGQAEGSDRVRGLLRHADLRPGALRSPQGRARDLRRRDARRVEPARLQAAGAGRRPQGHDDGGCRIGAGAADGSVR